MVNPARPFGLRCSDVVVLARLTALWKIAQLITGTEIESTAEIGLPEPNYRGRFAHMVPTARFGQRQTRAFFKASTLDTPLIMADPAALDLARKQCELQLDALSSGGRLVRSVRRLCGTATGLSVPRSGAR
jgi:hypothetical protein